MEKIIFRDDDICSNTRFDDLDKIYGLIHTSFPNAEIWACMTVFSQRNYAGSVYSEIPFKNKDINWFYKKADSILENQPISPLFKVASHGLYHIDHSKVSRQTQEMSILGSCFYLKSKKFVPPFNKFNQDTLDICFDNDIEIVTNGWKSLEHEKFNPEHKLWYFHSWRFNLDNIKEVLSELRTSKNS